MQSKKQFWLICFGLAILTLTIFLPVVQHDFINYDDPDYVTRNSTVQKGLTWEGTVWAFQTAHTGNWHPVTWLSHMLDCQVYGMSPGGHHFTNLVFHVVNALLLFSLLTKATRLMWLSAMVAVLFALHPLHVESVAWISERKDVLSTFFLLLSLGAYFRYAGTRAMTAMSARTELQECGRAPGFENTRTRTSALPYFLALIFFALGLMSKPMLVTLPFLLLLLDFWPLGRISFPLSDGKFFRKLLLEKIPFLALSVASSVVTFFVQKKGGSVATLALIPFPDRLGNTLVSYGRYLAKMFWPIELSVLYPLRPWPFSAIIFSAIVLLFISLAAFRLARRRPYFFVGWFWFLGTLVPVIGLVQVGLQSMADRYTYVPLIGLFVALVWGVSEFSRNVSRRILAGFAAAIVVSCAISTSFQLRHWQNSITLFRHAIAVTKKNYVAHNNLATALANEGQSDEAMKLFQNALQLKPNYAVARYNVAKILDKQGKIDEAIEGYKESLRLKSNSAPAHYGLGLDLGKKGNLAEAIVHYRAALEIDPGHGEAHYNLANALLRNGQTAEAISHYQMALKVAPGDADAHNNLANALQKQGALTDALEHFREAVRLKPRFADARFNLALLCIRQGRPAEATVQLSEVTRLQPTNEEAHYQLGILLANQRQTEAAIFHFREALRLKPDRPSALNFLARILATSADAKFRNADESVKLARQACALSQNKNFYYLDTLAAGLAEKKLFAEAIQVAEQAKALAASQGNATTPIEAHLEQFKAGQPLRE